jgi:hypothetical protein
VVDNSETAHRSKSKACDDDSTDRHGSARRSGCGSSAGREDESLPERPVRTAHDGDETHDIKTVLAREPDALPSRSPAARKQIENLHDFVADLVLGTWLAFGQGGTIVKARLSWISPWRATYIFANRSGSA